MNILKRQLLFLLLPALMLPGLFPPLEARAEEELYIQDDAGLFSDQEISGIYEKILTLREETEMDYMVATTSDAHGYSSQDYADETYEASGLGTGDDHSGMLYLIDLDNREIYISTEGQMLRYLTDERIDTILDHAYEDVVDGNYAASALTVLNDTEAFIEAGIELNQYNYSSETGKVDSYAREKATPIIMAVLVIFAVIAGLAAALGTFFSVKGRYQLTRDTYHYPLAEKSTLKLTVSEDRLINQFITHRRIVKNPPPSAKGHSGRTTTHVSGSGRTHGGGGRKF